MTDLTLLSVTEASAQVSVPKRTVQHAISKGDLKAAYKIPGRTGAYLITPQDLADWQANRTAKAAS